jgi:NTE family protein
MVKRIAIACQGGGSHAAFTAGVLHELLAPQWRDRYRLVGLSGTSGGAVCASLAWAGLIGAGPEDARQRLAAFWEELAAAAPLDAALNWWSLWAARFPFSAKVSPYAYAPLAEPALRRLLTLHLRPDELPAEPERRRHPMLLVGAANVLRGGGAAFTGETLTLDDVIASAAVPPLFRAVETRGELWWDGLYSQNPPVREMLRLKGDRKPQEIWVIRLNPRAQPRSPETAEEIEDRRNELAGNLPLDHELYLVEKLNRLRIEYPALQRRYAAITIRQVSLDIALDYASKLDRSPALLRELQARGRLLAPRFFDDASILRPDPEAPPSPARPHLPRRMPGASPSPRRRQAS